MPRITPVHWKILDCIFKLFGFTFERHKGDHRSYTCPGNPRPVVIPTYKEVDIDIIKSNMRTAGMSRAQYFKLLAACQ
ncbi:MAG: type II toxin-antitoxin system HicA family toxin [Thermodesulfobacteriota bacterium]